MKKFILFVLLCATLIACKKDPNDGNQGLGPNNSNAVVAGHWDLIGGGRIEDSHSTAPYDLFFWNNKPVVTGGWSTGFQAQSYVDVFNGISWERIFTLVNNPPQYTVVGNDGSLYTMYDNFAVGGTPLNPIYQYDYKLIKYSGSGQVWADLPSAHQGNNSGFAAFTFANINGTLTFIAYGDPDLTNDGLFIKTWNGTSWDTPPNCWPVPNSAGASFKGWKRYANGTYAILSRGSLNNREAWKITPTSGSKVFTHNYTQETDVGVEFLNGVPYIFEKSIPTTTISKKENNVLTPIDFGFNANITDIKSDGINLYIDRKGEDFVSPLEKIIVYNGSGYKNYSLDFTDYADEQDYTKNVLMPITLTKDGVLYRASAAVFSTDNSGAVTHTYCYRFFPD